MTGSRRSGGTPDLLGLHDWGTRVDLDAFLQDALSPQQNGSSSQLLAIVPTVAHVVMCAQARAELIDKLTGFDWSVEDVEARYGPVFDAAI